MSARRILVTGAASGIGSAVCRRMAGQGSAFVVHTRRNREGAEATVSMIRDLGGAASVEFADLARPGAGRNLVARAAKVMGGLDVLVVNAGYALKTPLTQVSDSEFEAAHATISRGFYEMATAAVMHLKVSTMPRIVAVSAFGPHVWRTSVLSFPATAAAKAAMEASARALALELAPDGIPVNVVAPGFVQKDAGAHRAMSVESLSATEAQIPMGRIGKTEEIAAVIAFCASADASYVTGQVIHVNGGLV